ncbi:MAG: hypothetical protein C0625_15825 [Arcobacter sp.]|nr:MAG: hypothetical protein C0625_15825 [Arcobacter sp.]
MNRKFILNLLLFGNNSVYFLGGREIKNINISNDITLIIECCKTEVKSASLEEKISSIKDWVEFVNLSYSHGVFPLVFHALKKFEKIIPKQIFQQMKTIHMDIVKQNMLMTSELIKVMKLLDKNNITAIPFKGPVLSQMAYGDITLRQYVDLDILIERNNNKKVFELLKTLNYKSVLSTKLLDRKVCSEIITDFNLKNTFNGVELEFHWQLIEKIFKMNLKYSEIVDCTIEVTVNNYKIKTFSLEHQVVYLAMHGSKHGWERIEWLVDLYRLIKINKDVIDWEKVIKLSFLSKSKKSVLTMLYLLKKLFGLNIVELDLVNKHINNEIKTLYKLSVDMILNYSQKEDTFIRKQKLESYRFKITDGGKFRLLYSLESLLSLSKLDCINNRWFEKSKILLFFSRFIRLIKGII